jgi:tetratricopeptide (TPR) repeat protein
MDNRKTSEKFLRHYEKALDYFIYQDKLELAVKEYQKVIRINPKWAQTYYDLGFIYSLKNDPNNSVKNYQTYLKLNPNASDRHEIEKTIYNLNQMNKVNYNLPLAS